MAEDFKPIETQEQFDKAIAARLAREQEKYTGQITELTGQVANLTAANKTATEKITQANTELAELRSTVKKHETDSAKRDIADEYGLPAGFYSRLNGENADELRADAQEMQKLFAAGRKLRAPLKSTEGSDGDDDKQAALRKMAKAVNGGN